MNLPPVTPWSKEEFEELRHPFRFGSNGFLAQFPECAGMRPVSDMRINPDTPIGDFLKYFHPESGRFYLAVFHHTGPPKMPDRLVRYREPFLSELLAARLLRKANPLRMNEWILDFEETIDLRP